MRAREIQVHNEGLLNKILDVMSKLAKSERLWAEAEQNTEAITERKDAQEKELDETKKAFAEKSAEPEATTQATAMELQRVYNQGQHDYISSVRPEEQNNLQSYYSLGWFTALDMLQVEATSSLQIANDILYPKDLIIIPNPEIQEIKDDISPVRAVDPTAGAMDPAAGGAA